MSVRVVARIRPLLKGEMEKDVIVHAEHTGKTSSDSKSLVRIPNPKNEAEAFSFQFNSVYDQEATQAHIFDNEGKMMYTTRIGGYGLIRYSLTHRQAALQRLRCHPLRIRRHGHRQDAHHARRQGAG